MDTVEYQVSALSSVSLLVKYLQPATSRVHLRFKEIPADFRAHSVAPRSLTSLEHWICQLPEVRKALLREVRESALSSGLNLSKVRYIDSSGVASLVEGLKASRDLIASSCSA